MKFRPLAAPLTIALLGAMAGFPASKSAKDAGKLFHTKLDKDQQILHALDRLTFGPRPGDVAHVRAIGLKKWIDQQLHPESIPENPVLAAKLEPLESLKMTPLEAVRNYPAPPFVRMVARGKQPLPDDPVLRATVQRLAARFKAKQDDTAFDPNEEMDPVKPLSELLGPEQIQLLTDRKAPDAQKRLLLASLTPDQMEDVVIALPRQTRQQLINAAPTEVRRKLMLMNSPQQVILYDLTESKLMRAVYSNRQLAEELDDFWFNHFNVYYDKGSDRFLIPSYERDAIRPNVLGDFRTLLEATAKSPAMLFYLDNFESVRPDIDAKAKNKKNKRGLNENYARELMELHTLGVNGGYTQKDVIEVARCFTGWTIEDPKRGGGFVYRDNLHDKGEKVVLGHVIPAGGGMNDGEAVLDILAHHPSTARFISTKLAERFVADNPPPSLIDKMAKTFLAKNGDIREVMKTMLSSKEFWSQGAYQQKVKTPFEMVVSSIRALDGDVDNGFPLANQITQMGEPLYRKLEPTGYSNLNSEWINSAALLARMNFALALAQNRVPGVSVDSKRFSDDSVIVAKMLLARNASASTLASINKALDAQKDKSPALLAGLIIGSPDFQRR